MPLKGQPTSYKWLRFWFKKTNSLTVAIFFFLNLPKGFFPFKFQSNPTVTTGIGYYWSFKMAQPRPGGGGEREMANMVNELTLCLPPWCGSSIPGTRLYSPPRPKSLPARHKKFIKSVCSWD